jgi:hypothetical protein
VSAVVGFGEVLQQTPLAQTKELPEAVTFPPLMALVWVIPKTGTV